jgi:hypothetical protein
MFMDLASGYVALQLILFRLVCRVRIIHCAICYMHVNILQSCKVMILHSKIVFVYLQLWADVLTS